MTQTLSVRCQNCGSPLQVGESIRFVTCGYCHSELQVVRDQSTVHTEILQKLEARTAEMSGSLKTIEIQNEIERLDREWDMWRQSNLPRGKSGQIQEPSPVATGIFGTVAAGFVIVWIVVAYSLTSRVGGVVSFVFPLFGLFVLAGLIYNVVNGMTAGSGYGDARKIYESKRTRLLEELSRVKEAQ